MEEEGHPTGKPGQQYRYMSRVSEALCGVLDTSESYRRCSSQPPGMAFLSATSSLDDLAYYIRSDFVAFYCSDLVA
jgi:hypothetical protein